MKTIDYDGTACHHCGRIVARNRKNSSGKGRVRHKCYHGRWCDTGSPLTATNNLAGCRMCHLNYQQVRDAKRRAVAEGK